MKTQLLTLQFSNVGPARVHNIQPDTPVENLMAMFSAVKSA